jgi:N-methylhydantoinase A
MRYRGQSFEIEVPFLEEWVTAGATNELEKAFNDYHERIYGYCDRSAPVQIVNIRTVILAETSKPQYTKIPEATKQLEPFNFLDIYSEDTMQSFAYYRREDMRAGHTFAGPCVVLQDDCTTCVLDGFGGSVDPYGNMILQFEK